MKQDKMTKNIKQNKEDRQIPDARSVETILPEDGALLDAYQEQLENETPDLWARIEAGFDAEMLEADKRNANAAAAPIKQETTHAADEDRERRSPEKIRPRRRRMPYVCAGLAAAAVLLAVCIVASQMDDRKQIRDNRTDTLTIQDTASYDDTDSAESIDDAYTDQTESANAEVVTEEQAEIPSDGSGSDAMAIDQAEADTADAAVTEQNQMEPKSAESSEASAEEETMITGVRLSITDITVDAERRNIYEGTVAFAPENAYGIQEGAGIRCFIRMDTSEENLALGDTITIDLISYDESTDTWSAKK